MKVSYFKNCCQVQELGGFGDSSYYSKELKARRIKSKKDLDKILANAKYNTDVRVILATTVPDQTHITPLLTKAGFERIKNFRSNYSGDVITLWFKLLPLKGCPYSSRY